MRGLVFFLIFVSSTPLIFVSPFNGVLIWYVFSLGNFHTLVYGAFSDLSYGYVIAILTCVAWLISRTERPRLPVTPLVVLTLLFSLWMTITSLSALAPPDEVWGKWVIVQKILFMCLVGFGLTTTRERVNQLVWVIVLSIGVWGVKGAVWVLLGGTGTIYGPHGGMIADNNDFGLALVMILPLLFYHWHTAKSRLLRRALLMMGFLLTVAVLFTYSRGALVGLCAMGVVFWLRSRAKLVITLLILAVAFFTYSFAPETWFGRMATIESYEADQSAMGRIYLWKVSLRIAEERPLIGGGFRVTFSPAAANKLLLGSQLPRLEKPRAAHSIYFDVISEHGWVGFALFMMVAAHAWLTCSWLIRHSRGRPDLAWGNVLGRTGQSVLVGYWAAGAFVSQAYLDEYWCALFLFEAARLVLAREIAITSAITPRALPTPRSMRLGAAQSR